MSQDLPEGSCFSNPLRSRRKRARHTLAAVLSAVGMALLTSCGGGGGTPTPSQPAAALQITASPALSPAFDPNISDYVVATPPGSHVQVTTAAPANTTVAVDNQAARGSTNTSQVTLAPGQSFAFVVNTAGVSKTYFVRALPNDFPPITSERTGTPQAEYYVVTPSRALTTDFPSQYVMIIDDNGVPVWWYHAASLPVDAKLLSNGNMAWTLSPTAEERKLDGSLVRTFTAAGILGGFVDNHEFQLLPNGNYLYIAIQNRVPFDLSAIGGTSNATVMDNIIVESAPDGTIVWRWSVLDHIPFTEIDPRWEQQYITNASPADPYHMNSIEPDGNGYVVSLRHLNAVIRIDRASGNIVWKLGGSARPESLTFQSDTFGNFGGQHDARILPDGTLSVHDNGSLSGRPPRAVRYSIDTVARTATLVEQVTDSDASTSFCCGGARKLPAGDWVLAWGSNSYFTELTPAGKRVFRFNFQPPFFSYRAAPILPGVLTRDALRNGMNAQFPR